MCVCVCIGWKSVETDCYQLSSIGSMSTLFQHRYLLFH